MAQTQKQYIDIPINLQDTPYYLTEKATTYLFPNDTIDVAHDLLARIEDAIRRQNQQQLYSLTNIYFQQADTQKFSSIDWPNPTQLETIKQRDYLIPAQTIYNQLINRKKFDKHKLCDEEFFKVVDDSWETYTTIFQHQITKVKYHPILIWDFFENFSYQFTQYHSRVLAFSPQNTNKEWFEIEKTFALLKKMEQLIPENPSSKSIHTQEIFGYYSLVIRATLQAYFGNFQNSLKTIQKIGSSCLIYYSKAFGAQLTLFLTSSYCQFMLEKYDKCARLCELSISFFNKYKKYLNKYTDRHVTRQYEKLVGMLCMSLIFLEEKPKNDIMDIFKNTAVKTKDRQHKQKISDKYIKMKQNDTNSFIKLFNFSSLPFLAQKSDIENQQKQIQLKFQNISQTTLNTIIQNYKQIPISKLSKFLNKTQEQVLKQIQQFNQISRGINPWQSTIMFPLLRQKNKIILQVNQGNLKINQASENETNRDWQSYIEELSWLVDKVKNI